MNKKIGLVVVVAVIAIASMQMSYAEEEYTKLVGCATDDNEIDPDLGSVSAIINDGNNLVISVYNAYPCYEAYVNYTVKHVGNLETAPTVYLDAIDITNPYAGVEMNVVVTDILGNPIPINTALDPGETLECLVTITMLDGAVEDESYLFNIDMYFSEHT